MGLSQGKITEDCRATLDGKRSLSKIRTFDTLLGAENLEKGLFRCGHLVDLPGREQNSERFAVIVFFREFPLKEHWISLGTPGQLPA